MTGVEILALEEIVTDYTFNWSFFCIAFAVVFAIFVGVGTMISVISSNWINIKIGIVLGLILGLFGGTMFGVGERIPVEYEDQYKVVISDEVSMNDFLTKYKIVEQEGRIFTVVEKEQEGE